MRCLLLDDVDLDTIIITGRRLQFGMRCRLGDYFDPDKVIIVGRRLRFEMRCRLLDDVDLDTIFGCFGGAPPEHFLKGPPRSIFLRGSLR